MAVLADYVKIKIKFKNAKDFFFYVLAIVLGSISGLLDYPILLDTANYIANVFVLAFKWLSIPIISLSILSTTSNLHSTKEFFTLGRKILKYTILTTVVAAVVALGLFLFISPANTELAAVVGFSPESKKFNLFGFLLIGTVFVTLALSVIIVTFSFNGKEKFQSIVNIGYKSIMTIIQKVLYFMPIAIWAFVAIFMHDINSLIIKSLGLYLVCVLLANLIQALVILPLLLKYKNINVLSAVRNMLPALIVAFWSKSSSVALPVATDCAINRAGLSPKVAKFSLPLCTTINMNACAAFILITVLFVSVSHGVIFSPLEYAVWIIVATLAAIGNAGVPMGCYTLSGAILAYMGVPLHILGLILPFYALIDMLESSINVWSDSCVAMVVNKELKIIEDPEAEPAI